jgi:mannose-6-phosphate isomerase-like protein (cupin superfamily)
MIRQAAELTREKLVALRGGKGELEMTHILQRNSDEFGGKGRLFAKMVLPPGASIGTNKHVGEGETFFVLSGEATVDDDGVKSVLKPGDMMLTGDGQEHCIENTGDVDLELIALILFS